MHPIGSVAALWRYPVKSMLGEPLDTAEVTERGVVGDRAYAVADRRDGRIATGKHPRKWGRLLELRAAYVHGPEPRVAVTFPDGSVVGSDDPGIDTALSAHLDREVTLVGHAAGNPTAEEVWPRIDGLAPDGVVEAISQGRQEGGEPVSDIPVASMAPPGTFFDLTTLHLLTTATLRRLEELAPDADFDARRYRPNVLVEVDGSGFVENDWTGAQLTLGSSVTAHVDLPTMRCVMTTLARDGMSADRGSLQAIARHNRVEIPGMGRWACAGTYASVTGAGTVAVGDPVHLAE